MSLNLNIEEFEASTSSNSLNQNESLPLESEGLVVSEEPTSGLGLSWTEFEQSTKENLSEDEQTYLAEHGGLDYIEQEQEKAEEHDFFRGFAVGKSDMENWGIILDAKYPTPGWRNKFSKPRKEGESFGKLLSAQDLYGYDDPKMPLWADMGWEARRIRLLELYHNNLEEKFPELADPDREVPVSETMGSMLAALMSPTTLIGGTKGAQGGYKMASAIAGFLGFEYGVAEGLADEGQINWKDTAMYTGMGIVIAPALLWTGRTGVARFKKYKAAKNYKLQKKSADEILDTYDHMAYEAVFSGERAADIPTKINHVLGISVKELRELEQITGRRIIIPGKETAKKYFENLKKLKLQEEIKPGGPLDRWLGNISTRIKNMDESIFHRLRTLEFNTKTQLNKNLTEVKPFLESLSKIKNKSLKSRITMAMYNGDANQVELLLTGKPDLLNSYKRVRVVLNSLHKNAKDAGLNLGYLEDYFPRQIKDAKALKKLYKFLGVEKQSRLEALINSAQKKKGSALTELERGDIVNKFLLESFPTGSQVSQLKKGRKIDEITSDLLQFYSKPEDALYSYIRRVVTETEKVKFFGKSWRKNKLSSGTDIDSSVGFLVDDAFQKGKISQSQVDELSQILQARFINGEKSPHWAMRMFKSLTYAATLGNPRAAATQLGDTFLAAYKSGNLLDTFKTLSTQVLIPGRRNTLRIQDYGLIDISEEFTTEGMSKTHSFMRWAFKWSGFRGVDRVGKELILNQGFKKYMKEVGNPTTLAAFKKKWLPSFGDDLPDLIADLKAGNLDSERVRLLLWHELSDMQPISLSEMPQKYLEHPNGRTFYMLKTFTLKQFDVMRRDAFQLMANKGTRIEGAKNLLRYSTYFVAGGMTSANVKKWLMGEVMDEDDWNDAFINNVWKLGGWNKYGADKFSESSDLATGTYEAGKGIIGIPTSPWINMVKTALSFVDNEMLGGGEEVDYRGVKNVPIFGQQVYKFLLGGAEADEQRERDEKNKEFKKTQRTEDTFLDRLQSSIGFSEGGLVSNMQRLGFDEGGEVKEQPNWFRRKFNKVDSYLNDKIDDFSETMHADEGFTKYMQHWLVDAPIELSKKLPFIDDETYEYTPIPEKIKSKHGFDKSAMAANLFQGAKTTAKNLPPSARDLNKALIHMGTHPIETVDTVLDVSAGAIANALPQNWVDTIDNFGASFGLASSKPQQEMASAFGQMIINDYGTLEDFKRTAMSNPAQVMLDMWAAGTLAKLGYKTALSKIPKTVKDITPEMKEKFLATVQNMDLPVEKVLDKGVLGFSLAPKKSEIFPTPDSRPLGKKESDEGMYNATELEKNEFFKDINMKQRTFLEGSRKNTPEALMLRFQREIGGGVMSFAMEHAGDFLWRMTTPTGLTGNFEGDSVLYKAENVRSRLENNYGFHTEFLENVYNNIDADDIKIGTKEFTKQLNNAHDIIKSYGEAHNKLPVYNAAQWVAREVPIEIATVASQSLKPYIIKENFDERGNYIGPKPKADYSKAIRLLRALESQTRNNWSSEAGQILKNKEGKPIEFNIDVTNTKLDSTMIEHNLDKLRTFINVDDINGFLLFGDDTGPMKEYKIARDAKEEPKEKLKPFDLEDLKEIQQRETGLTPSVKEVDDFMDDLVLVKGEGGEFGLADKNVAKNVDKDGIYRGKTVIGSDIIISPKWDSWTGKPSKTDFTMGNVGIPEKFRNKRLGKRLYLKMMDELIKKDGERLSGDMMSSDAVRLWKSLIKTTDQDLVDLGFPQLVGVLNVSAPAFELAIEEAKQNGYLTSMEAFKLGPNSKTYDPYETKELGEDGELYMKHYEGNNVGFGQPYSLEGMTVEEDAALFEVWFNTRKYKENIRDLVNRRASGETIKQYAKGGTVSEYDFKLTNGQWTRLTSWFRTQYTPKLKNKQAYLRSLSPEELENMWTAMLLLDRDIPVNTVAITNDGKPLWFEPKLAKEAVPRSMPVPKPDTTDISHMSDEDVHKAAEIAEQWKKALKVALKNEPVMGSEKWLQNAAEDIKAGLRSDSFAKKQAKRKEEALLKKSNEQDLSKTGTSTTNSVSQTKEEKPGWKMAKDGNYWSIDTAHKHWQTQKGVDEAKEIFGDKPGWVNNEAFYKKYRRQYADGGLVSPFDGLEQSIIDEIESLDVFNWIKKKAKKKLAKGFDTLGDNPTREQVESLWTNNQKSLGLLAPEIQDRITNTYEDAYDSYFNLDIPTGDDTKVAGAVATGGGFLRPLLSAGTQGASKATPLLSAFVPGTAQAPTTTEMYGVEFGTPEYYSAGVSFSNSLLSNKKNKREDRINRTDKIEELKSKNAQTVAKAKARDEEQKEVKPSSGPSTRGTRGDRTPPPPRMSSGPTRRGSRRGRKKPTRRLTPGR